MRKNHFRSATFYIFILQQTYYLFAKTTQAVVIGINGIAIIGTPLFDRESARSLFLDQCDPILIPDCGDYSIHKHLLK